MSHLLFLSLALVLLLALTASVTCAADNPVEVGAVNWGRDIDAAMKRSEATGKPVLVLFQEVPGCHGCKTFGKTVLKSPLLVEAIEDEFVPVLVHNNTNGIDKAILDRFEEPAWNNPVIRFLNADGTDVIPRKDRVWTLGSVASRMTKALDAARRPVPKYLALLAAEHDTTNHATAAFAQHCYWVGEAELGRIDGVITTEAGWIGRREVTRVVYDKTTISLETLAERAKSARCAETVYAPGSEASSLVGFDTEPLDGRYRKAKASDQKKQIERMKDLLGVPGLTDAQKTKLNALSVVQGANALEWLSPRQRQALAHTPATRAE